MATTQYPVQKSDEEWRRILTPEQYAVLRGHATEPPGSCALLHEKREGTFTCAGCGQPLFRAGREEVRRNVEHGVFAAHPADQVLNAIGGLALFQILTAPLARRVTGEDPLSPDNVERQVEVATHFALAGLHGARRAAPARKRGTE